MDRTPRQPRKRQASKSLAAFSEALTEDDLGVVFQPIVDLSDGSMFAVEALVRCKTPSLSPPPVLFDHAVKHDYCGRLGRMIRDLTVRHCSGLPIFTNVHPVELSQRWLVRPDDPIFSHDSDIYLEITESVPFSHFDQCVSVLEELRGRGSVHLVIDDLGSGFSNLKRIVDLAPRIVKLDLELIRGIDKDSRQQRLVRSIVSMCEHQNADVVAEGIETVDELKAVIDSGAQYGQGYLLAKPANPIPAIDWPKI